jgi:hypothetical protein
VAKFRTKQAWVRQLNSTTWNRNRQEGKLDSQDLKGLDFTRKERSGIDFSGLRLDDACFRRCKLNGANFDGSNLENCNFEYAHLVGANLAGANLKGTNFRFADIRNTTFSETTNVDWHSFAGANVHGSNLQLNMPEKLTPWQHAEPERDVQKIKPNKESPNDRAKISREEFASFRKWVDSCLSGRNSANKQAILDKIDEIGPDQSVP